jgi:hypothetical protein
MDLVQKLSQWGFAEYVEKFNGICYDITYCCYILLILFALLYVTGVSVDATCVCSPIKQKHAVEFPIVARPGHLGI